LSLHWQKEVQHDIQQSFDTTQIPQLSQAVKVLHMFIVRFT